MSNSAARAIASIAACAACGVIGWAVPMSAFMSIVGMVLSICYIWRNA